MLSEQQIETYRRDGYLVIPRLIQGEQLGQLRALTDRIVDEARGVPANDELYAPEPSHSATLPRVRRLKPTIFKRYAFFHALARDPAITSILAQLLGPAIRQHGGKLNMKSAGYGSPVEWHQDWAFYPHTNDDVLAIGIYLDDCDLANGPMLVTPGTHNREVWEHHGDDGCFAGLIDPDTIKDEIECAVPCIGRAGSMSFHHVRALHGSAMNTSDRPRNLLLYEVAASDAWPLMGVKDFAEFNSRLLSGDPVIAPRMTNVPVRLPLPPATRPGPLYETPSPAKKSYFTRAA